MSSRHPQGRSKSDFGLYRLLVARSQILWGDRVHVYQIAGALMIIAGTAIAVTG